MPNGQTKCINLFNEYKIGSTTIIRAIEGVLTPLQAQKVASWLRTNKSPKTTFDNIKTAKNTLWG